MVRPVFSMLNNSLNKMVKSLKNEKKTGVFEANAVLKAINLVRKKNKG